MPESVAFAPLNTHLMLKLRLHDADVVKLFRALESNRTVSVLDLLFITFWRRTAKALVQLVERNHKLVSVTVSVDDKNVDVDCAVQIRYICRELKEALAGNRLIMDVTALVQRSQLHSFPDIKHVLGRNTMLINRAIRFVMGSMEKEDALAFEILRHSESLNITLKRKWKIPRKRALVMIAEARDRLTFNYFALAGVVRAKVACHRNLKGRKKQKQRKQTLLDDISRDLQARICSYLSLTDVVDI
ncbi:hypothetical protein HPB50_015168 [Hyalomma asiaticum]|uniref:Uncharacterized protein n=1 Tax=Hyalomma asiaticum TaxID=266040 RepID=A0ACB7RJC7_HYAAI|nr:hypothetical protein HPB50_015168 [Hyalomma asiaticum]